MIIDRSKMQFFSKDQVDKIPVYSTMDDSSGVGPQLTLAVGTPANPVLGGVWTAQIPNPYGKKLLITGSVSDDGINFLPFNTPKFYFNVGAASYLYKFIGYMGSDDDFIYFAVTTNYTANQQIIFQFGLDSPT